MFSEKHDAVVRLFDRSVKPASTWRDPEADRLIADASSQASHAADTPDDVNTDGDSYFTDDDTRIE